MRRRFIDRFDVLLLDMGLTFMFDADHFSDSEDYGATYRQIGGNTLTDGAVYRMISALFEKLLADYTDPGLYDRYPSVVSRLKTIPEAKSFPETEIRLLERVFEMHEVGVIPTTHAEALHQLRETHRLGVVSNIWSRSDIYLQEFERAGVKHLFDIIIFMTRFATGWQLHLHPIKNRCHGRIRIPVGFAFFYDFKFLAKPIHRGPNQLF